MTICVNVRELIVTTSDHVTKPWIHGNQQNRLGWNTIAAIVANSAAVILPLLRDEVERRQLNFISLVFFRLFGSKFSSLNSISRVFLHWTCLELYHKFVSLSDKVQNKSLMHACSTITQFTGLTRVIIVVHICVIALLFLSRCNTTRKITLYWTHACDNKVVHFGRMALSFA